MAKTTRRDQLVKQFMAKNPGPPNFPRYVPKRPGAIERKDQWGGLHSSTPGHGGLGVGDKQRGTWRRKGRNSQRGLSTPNANWQRT